jgi:hypothetical protein
MVKHSIVDWVELIALGINPGVVIKTKWKALVMVDRITTLLSICVWYQKCVLFVLIPFSRWIAKARPYFTKKIFT